MVSALGASRQLYRLLAEMDRRLPRRELPERASKALLRPSSFALFNDPPDRFEFRYPAEWTLYDGATPTVSSPKLGLFVRVDLLPPEGEILPLLTDRFPGLTVRAWREGLPTRVEGLLAWQHRRFKWTSAVFTLRGTRIAFSTGSILDGASPSIATYRRNILTAIRRHFRLSPGLRSE